MAGTVVEGVGRTGSVCAPPEIEPVRASWADDVLTWCVVTDLGRLLG